MCITEYLVICLYIPFLINYITDGFVQGRKKRKKERKKERKQWYAVTPVRILSV